MSTTENDNDLKKGGGYLKEKFVIGMSRWNDDEVERAVVKVTSHMLKAPNEKHMQRLLAATHGTYSCGKVDHGDINRYIVTELEKRSHTHNWIVVLKTMVAFHRLMSDGSIEVNRILQSNRNIFCLRHIKDLADSPDGAAQQQFIELYIKYLEERGVAQQAIGLSTRLESDQFADAINSMDPDTLTRSFGILLQQLEALNGVEFRTTIVDNFCTLEAYRKLVVDGKKLFAILSARMIFILEQFEDFPLPMKRTWLKLYLRYQKGVKTLSAFFLQIETANIHFGEPIPKLKVFPDSLQKRLEDEIASCSVEKEDLTSVIGAMAVAELKLAPPPSATPAAVAQPVAVVVEKARSPQLTVLPPQPKNDSLSDIFGPSTHTQPQQQRSAAAPSAAPSANADLFGGPRWEDVKQPFSPVEGSGPATAPPVVRQQPKPAEFDPFAAPPPVQQQAQPKAASPATSNVNDFFASAPNPQQSQSNRGNVQQNSQQPQATPFSDLAAQGKAKAW